MFTFRHCDAAAPRLTELPPRLLLRGSGTGEGGVRRGCTRENETESGGHAREEPEGRGIHWGESALEGEILMVGSPRSSVTRVEGGRGSIVFEESKAAESGSPRGQSPHSLRRGRALHAGLLTLLILAWSLWITIEATYAVVILGGTGRGVVRWVEVGVGSVVLVGCVICIIWLKTRRSSPLSIIALLSSTTATVLHTALATSNVVFVLILRSELEDRCTWGVDYAWDLGKSGYECQTGDEANWSHWVVAAFVRLSVTVFIGILWNVLLVRFKSSLVPTISPPTSTSPSSRPNHLPSMPSRSHRILPSESSIAFEDSHDSNSSGMWIKAKLWGAIAWAIGAELFEDNGRRERETAGEKMLLRMGRGSENLPGQRMSGLGIGQYEREGSEEVRQPRDLDDPLEEDQGREHGVSRRETYPPSPSDSATLSSPSVWARSPALSDHTCTTSIGQQSPMDSRVLTYSSPPPSPSPSPSPSPLPAVSYASSTTSSDDSYSDAHELSSHPFDPPHPPFLGEPTGSSGSSGGSLIYVRMSDGRLVRKLSTIASIAEQESIAGGGGGGGHGTILGWDQVEAGVEGWRSTLPRDGRWRS